MSLRSPFAPGLRGLVALSVALSVSCGARDLLSVGPAPGDAGAPVDQGEPPLLTCGASVRYTLVRVPIALVGDPSGVDDAVSFGWVAVGGGGELVIEPGASARASFHANAGGTYRVAFDVRRSGGEGVRCEVSVVVVEGPPVAVCPSEPVETLPTLPVAVAGEGVDDIAVVGYQWDPVSGPAGAVTTLQDRTSSTTLFSADRMGTYTLRLTVYDEDGSMGTCMATVEVLPRPTVTCPAGPIEARVGEAVPLMATVTNPAHVTRELWSVPIRPNGSTAAPSPAGNRSTRFTPDVAGTYSLRFTAEDALGVADSCDVTVNAAPPLPVLRCTNTIETLPLTTVTVTAALNAGVSLRRMEWTVQRAPHGSAARPLPPEQLTTRLTPDLSGEYVLLATATDDVGQTATCTTRILAYGQEGLRVEMFWNTNRTDMDLHLLHPRAEHWFQEDFDCYWRTCIPGTPWTYRLQGYNWGYMSLPTLDVDNVRGFGPENINVATPEAGTYRVGVVSWLGGADATVRIYCGGEHVDARIQLGPTALYGGRKLWRVADVTIRPDGSCNVVPLGDVVPVGTWAVPR